MLDAGQCRVDGVALINGAQQKFAPKIVESQVREIKANYLHSIFDRIVFLEPLRQGSHIGVILAEVLVVTVNPDGVGPHAGHQTGRRRRN